MRRGFTLVEGLVAMFILTLVFFAAIGLYPSSVLANLQAGDQVTASAIAQRILEDARMQDFHSLSVGTVQVPSETVNDRVFQVRQIVTAPSVDVRQFSVTVSWTGHTAESVSYQTAIFNYEGGTK